MGVWDIFKCMLATVSYLVIASHVPLRKKRKEEEKEMKKKGEEKELPRSRHNTSYLGEGDKAAIKVATGSYS